MVIPVTGYCAAMAVLAAAASEPAGGSSGVVEADRPEEAMGSRWACHRSARLLAGKGSSKGKGRA